MENSINFFFFETVAYLGNNLVYKLIILLTKTILVRTVGPCGQELDAESLTDGHHLGIDEFSTIVH